MCFTPFAMLPQMIALSLKILAFASQGSPHPADDDLQYGPPVCTQQVDLINDQQPNLGKERGGGG
jgi:hypothetical protein